MQLFFGFLNVFQLLHKPVPVTGFLFLPMGCLEGLYFDC